jgi:hypothetical protein
MRDTLISAYLDFLNNYATVLWYAEDNGLTYAQAISFLNLAKSVYLSEHPEA